MKRPRKAKPAVAQPDPLVILARSLPGLVAERDRLDNQHKAWGDPAMKKLAEAELEHAEIALHNTEDAILRLRPNTISGALVQLFLATGILDTTEDPSPRTMVATDAARGAVMWLALLHSFDHKAMLGEYYLSPLECWQFRKDEIV